MLFRFVVLRCGRPFARQSLISGCLFCLGTLSSQILPIDRRELIQLESRNFARIFAYQRDTITEMPNNL